MLDNMIDTLILAPFVIASSALAIYGLHLYVLVWLFRRRTKAVSREQSTVIDAFHASVADEDWPIVTSQIPMYNERDVSKRIIRAVVAMEYPAGRHEIQVLDDSDDETRDIVDRVVEQLARDGADIKVVRRAQRTGYKAGALAEGVSRARGEFLAVFDADFVPPADFLRRSIPLLANNDRVACLQARWGHLNLNESWLTRAQALGIDGHFAIEQGARAWNGLLMNFNGTAGVWRKAAINDPNVGGWSGDTLTEDLDLSYRAQLAGWKMQYSFDLTCPAELPADVNAFKSQQRRWATGSIQVAVKLLPRIWGAPLRLSQKLEATLHLTHYSVAVWMFVLAVVARPMLIVCSEGKPLSQWFWILWSAVILSSLAPPLTYGYARWCVGGRFSGIRLIPQLMVLGCGMCVNNSVAVIRGLFSKGGEFVRTPKSGSKAAIKKRGSYRPVFNQMWILEIALGFYSLFSFARYVQSARWPISLFLLLYSAGFLIVGWLSRPPGIWESLGRFLTGKFASSNGDHRAVFRRSRASDPPAPVMDSQAASKSPVGVGR